MLVILAHTRPEADDWARRNVQAQAQKDWVYGSSPSVLMGMHRPVVVVLPGFYMRSGDLQPFFNVLDRSRAVYLRTIHG